MSVCFVDTEQNYSSFLVGKAQSNTASGFDPIWMPDFLFDFQQNLVEWALRQGKAAIYADCGLGKTVIQLVWAENVVRKTGKPVLILTPLAVSFQTEKEAAKFGIAAAVSRDGRVHERITLTNYEQLEKFDCSQFGGVVCDESSAIKSFDGARRALVTEFLRLIPYRLLCTATAAPNDYIELGTSSEALGQLGYMDMLARFFTNDQHTSSPLRTWNGGRTEWRFKGHAEEAFWRWVSSWARAMRRPSDLGFSDDRFILPPLNHRQHVVVARRIREGALFDMPAIGLREEREESRRTLDERCETAANLLADVDRGIAWCYLNDEGDLLTNLIDGAVQVSGHEPVEAKEEKLMAFVNGQIRVLVTKPLVAGWGMNFQHCAHMTFFPSHSYEQYYQAVRRCWRFGQTRPVMVNIVTTEGGANALKNLERKALAADRMFSVLVSHMKNALTIQRSTDYTTPVEVPSWL